MISMNADGDLPVRPTPHERDGRQEGGGEQARPHSSAVFAGDLMRLYRQHRVRLVRAVRARLGRYDWYAAEDIAAETWLRAAEEGARPPADPAAAWEWLSGRARQEQIRRYRVSRPAAPQATAYDVPEWPPYAHGWRFGWMVVEVQLSELLEVAA
jgi:DNA-directed RNA polymerase specialized sigma24 family protein